MAPNYTDVSESCDLLNVVEVLFFKLTRVISAAFKHHVQNAIFEDHVHMVLRSPSVFRSKISFFLANL